jgi:3D (Asp-Asp-Asp) domain-containing protein
VYNKEEEITKLKEKEHDYKVANTYQSLLLKSKNKVIKDKDTIILKKENELNRLTEENKRKVNELQSEINALKKEAEGKKKAETAKVEKQAVPAKISSNDVKTSVKKVVKTPVQTTTKTETFVVTAYTNGAESTGKTSGDPAYGVTASGDRTKNGVTLSCPTRFPFGTKMKIEGVGIRTCTDTGSAITGNRLDLFISDLTEARNFGRRTLAVEILN